MNNSLPEKLNIWDRFFNRYKKTIHARGTETWFKTLYGVKVPNTEFSKNWIEYKITDRITGSEKIKKEYLD